MIHQSLIVEDTAEEQAKREAFFDNIDAQRRKKYGLDDSLMFSYRYFLVNLAMNFGKSMDLN